MRPGDPARELEEIAVRGRLRRIAPLADGQGAVVSDTSGARLVNFSSNDYLGLASHPAICEAAARCARDHGFGSGASRLVCGAFGEHGRLEEEIAAFKGTEAALTFSSGYLCGLTTITALLGRDDFILVDRLAHACLIDGARHCGATLRVFGHNRLDHLESHLKWARSRAAADSRILIATESVFSMDGDTAPLAEIVEMKERYGALLLVDEAHATGILGPGGRGLAAAADLTPRIDLHMGTLSKALGTHGGFIAASRPWIDLLINRARGLIYSTAPPPPVAAAASAAVAVATSAEGDVLRRALGEAIGRLSDVLAPRAITRGPESTATPILPWIVGDDSAAVETAAQLRQRGILVPAIRPPTVPPGTARLRFTTCATHTPEHIAELIRALG